MFLSTDQERRIREIIRHMRTRAGSFALAYWLAPEPTPSQANHYYFTGRKGKPKKLWFTYGRSERRQSILVAECAASLSDADAYAVFAQALEGAE